MKRKNIEDVFTPRNATVNRDMYVERILLEDELKNKMKGSMNIIIYGESGCGKSWLYKNEFKKSKKNYKTINLAYVEEVGGILEYMYKEAFAEVARKVGYTETKEAGIDAIVVNSSLKHEGQYEINTKSALFAYLDRYFSKAPGFICFENLEVVFTNMQMMKQLANLIIMLDDEEFAKYKTKFVIVGVPSNILNYFSQIKNLSTVANRLVELSEVKPMEKMQVDDFVERGFIRQLKIEFEERELDLLKEHINFITGGVPQRMHEYSEVLSNLIEKNDWIFSTTLIIEADKEWIKDSLYQNYEVVMRMMNSENTNIGRRNQVLYCIGKLKSKSFSLQDIEKLMLQEFPETCINQNLNLSIPLGDISESNNPIISKKNKVYLILDMKYLLCIRTMLSKVDGKVKRLDLNQL
jgi:hypothetical protein